LIYDGIIHHNLENLRTSSQKPCLNESISESKDSLTEPVSHQLFDRNRVLTDLSYSAQRHAAQLPSSRSSSKLDAQSPVHPPYRLTERNFNLHNMTHGRPLPKTQRWNKWLDNVVHAMQKGELEDAMHNSWDLESDPERRIVDLPDRPDDEWDNIVWQRRFRDRPVSRDAWGNMSER
jgi:hypothetical protein